MQPADPPQQSTTALVAGRIAENRARRVQFSDLDSDTASALVPADGHDHGQDDQLIEDIAHIVAAVRRRSGLGTLQPAPPPQQTVVVVERETAPPAHGLLWSAVERHRQQMSVPRACCIFCAIMWCLVLGVVAMLVLGYVLVSRMPPAPSAIKRGN
jgi:hypothetical protein